MEDFTNNYDRVNYSAMNLGSGKYDNKANELLKLQDDKIKQLKRTVKAYQKNSAEQQQKLSNHDNWYVDYNSWNKNYTELENELNQFKVENLRLNEIIQTKNGIISEFQKWIDLSTSKFQIYDETNMSWKLKNEELERKVQVLPSWSENNAQWKQNISEYDAKIEGLKNEFSKKEEWLKLKISNWENNNKATIRQYDEELSEQRLKIETMKLENERNKRVISDLKDALKESDIERMKKWKEKEMENEKLGKTVLKLQSELQDLNNSAKGKWNSKEKYSEELENQIRSLNEEITSKNEKWNQLNEILMEYDNTIKESEQELRLRESLISQAAEEKEKIWQQLNLKQLDFVEYQKSSQQEIDILHKKLNLIDKERSAWLNNSTSNEAEIKVLKDQINMYESNTKTHWDECKEVDYKYNELVKALEAKEEESQLQTEKFNEIIKKTQSEVDTLRLKYDKKVKTLQLSNEELNSRCKNLITTLISLKDYAMSIERNWNDNTIGNNWNTSHYSCMPTSSQYHYTGYNNNVKQSRQLIKGMKEMISRIDCNILEGA